MSSMTEKSPKMIPVILSGGMGTRLWPLSRESKPKQFLDIAGDTGKTMFHQTLERVSDGKYFADPVVICNESHRFAVAETLQKMQMSAEHILLEPVGRNTAPALTIAAKYCAKHFGDDAVMLVLPSDHLISKPEEFHTAVLSAFDTAKNGFLTTFGITPTHAETGYGYIEMGDVMAENAAAHTLKAFVEKPNLAAAEHYLNSGDYVWNSGMFVFPVTLLLNEIGTHRPEILAKTEIAFENCDKGADFVRFSEADFGAIPAESIDYAVMEHTKKAAVIAVDCGWTDAGSFHALWKSAKKDKQSNVSIGENYMLDSKGNYLDSRDGVPITLLGVDNVVVISTKDCIMVASREQSQKVRDLVKLLQDEKPKLVSEYRHMERPWGSYDSIDNGENHQVKNIKVKPGASLSLQMHYKRAEHWMVVKGVAEVTVGEEVMEIKENGHVYIPKEAKHRLTNHGDVELVLIEVQYGSYLGEDDIVRYDDIYGRVK